MNFEEELHILSDLQKKLYSMDKMLSSQNSQQQQLTSQIQSFSNKLICELRLLSLVRGKLVQKQTMILEKISRSQILHGLAFAALEYCPSVFESNLLNHYMSFIAFIRNNPNILAKCLYYYSVKNPQKSISAAYSVFLTIFQQGWCKEEDELIFHTLSEFAHVQFGEHIQVTPKSLPSNVNHLKTPLSDPSSILESLNPLAHFVTAYLFNGAAISYLQCALENVFSILLSMSSLRDLRNQFSQTGDITTNFQYWKMMCEHAALCYNSLLICIELLPAGTSLFFNEVRRMENGNEKCILLFFEGFVNRALDNPAMLGLFPWHPGQAEWSPARDIAAIFRSKYVHLLQSQADAPLVHILSNFPTYKTIDIDHFLDVLTDTSLPHTTLISEQELLATNPNFPKELVITGHDLCVLHKCVLELPEESVTSTDFQKVTKRLGALPQIPQNQKEYLKEHFRIVLQPAKKISDSAKRFRFSSLFSSDSIRQPQEKQISKPKRDAFAQFFCEVLSEMPPLDECEKSLRPFGIIDFREYFRILAPHFLEDIYQCESIMYFSIFNAGNFTEQIQRFTEVADSKQQKVLDLADKTSALRIQHQRIKWALGVISGMRENAQSHILFDIANNMQRMQLSVTFQNALSKSSEFLTSLLVFNNSLSEIVDAAARTSTHLGFDSGQTQQILRILFFKMTDHISLQRYLMADSDVWKQSVIITNLIEKHKAEITGRLFSKCQHEFLLRKPYLQRAANLLGHIKPSSGIAVILYYVVSVTSIVTDLCNTCPLPIDQSMVWIVLNATAPHLYGIGKYVGHFLLGNGFSDSLIQVEDIKKLGTFCSGLCSLLQECVVYDRRLSSYSVP